MALFSRKKNGFRIFIFKVCLLIVAAPLTNRIVCGKSETVYSFCTCIEMPYTYNLCIVGRIRSVCVNVPVLYLALSRCSLNLKFSFE